MSGDGITLIATGARTGHTFRVGKQHFVNGITVVVGSGAVRYFGKAYKAFPVGSASLKQAQKADAENPYLIIEDGVARVIKNAAPRGKRHGASEIRSSGGERRSGQSVPSGVQSHGGEPQTVSTDDGEGADDSEDGDAKGVSSGYGREDTRYDGETSDEERISKAVSALDPDNDEHWTSDGRPRIDAVEELSGLSGINRQMVDPLGIKRPKSE